MHRYINMYVIIITKERRTTNLSQSKWGHEVIRKRKEKGVAMYLYFKY